MFEEKIKLGDLYDFYGNLLTDKQQEIIKLHCIHDFSLGEISEDLGISRQAVYDTLKRSRKILKSYEEKLGLLDKFLNTKNRVNGLIKDVEGLYKVIDNDYKKRDALNQIDEIKEGLIEILDKNL
ncbi:MAG: hypothetical protein MJA82_13875 [Clostridia bacterium]|nr:hypothetical protein [Clostridia bacterium]